MLVLDPPYLSLRSLSRRPLAVGSILVGSLEGGAVVLADLRSYLSKAPGCSVCLLDTDPAADQRVIRAFEPYPHCFARVQPPSAAAPSVPGMVEAVRRRPFHSAGELARFTAGRLGKPDLVPTLSTCFELHGEGEAWSKTPHRSTLSRQLRDLKPFTARDWSSLARLARVLASPAIHGGVSQERAALEHEIDVRTLSGWLDRYLRLSFSKARECAGWEWVIERGLRSGGYVSDSLADARMERLGTSIPA